MTVEKHILGYVRQAEQKTRAKGGTTAYDDCCQQMRSVDLGQITAEQVESIVDRFLLDWGNMGRVINDHRRTGWQAKLAEMIRHRSGFLASVGALDLSGQNLAPNRSAIEDCYNSFCWVVGPTSAGKVLHLMAPSYFPPWDNYIRDLAWRFPRAHADLKRGLERDSGGEYYFFMLQIQHFLQTYLAVWQQLAGEFQHTKVKMIDRYLWQNQQPLAWIDLDPQQWRLRAQALSIVGIGHDQASDVAERHDDYLADAIQHG